MKSVRKTLWRSLLPPLLPLALMLFAVELAVRSGWIHAFLIPPPSQVFRCFFTDREELWAAFLETSLCSAIGLMMSFWLGTAAALMFSLSSFLRRAIYPYAIFFQTVPIVAIAPLLVIWFGFGRPTVVASACIVSIFPVIASTLFGLNALDPALVDLFRLHSATRLDFLFRLRLPSALPHVFAGFKLASGLAVIGAIVGEFIAGGGLGAVVDAARTQQRIDKVFAAVILSAGLGLLITTLIDITGRSALRLLNFEGINEK